MDGKTGTIHYYNYGKVALGWKKINLKLVLFPNKWCHENRMVKRRFWVVLLEIISGEMQTGWLKDKGICMTRKLRCNEG